MPKVIDKLKISFYLILINLHLKLDNPMWLVAIVLEIAGTEFI